MCDVAAIGPAMGAIGNAAGVAQENKAKKRAYNHKLKVRERKWFQERSTYNTKKVQFAQNVDLGNIEAQRVYTEINKKLYDARSMAILNDLPGFKKMLSQEGDIMTSAAERGIRGNSLKKLLLQNQQNYGLEQAMTARGLTDAFYNAKSNKLQVRNKLKSTLNEEFGKVAVAPIPDIAAPPPVMGNVGLTLMLGMGEALGAGLSA